jgi:hypothetical protein
MSETIPRLGKAPAGVVSSGIMFIQSLVRKSTDWKVDREDSNITVYISTLI